MSENNNATPVKKSRRPALIAGIVVIAALALAPLGYTYAYSGRIFPGVSSAGVSLGGLTREEALAKLNAKTAIFGSRGLAFFAGKHHETVSPAGIFSADAKTAIEYAYQIGRSGNPIQNVANAAAALKNGLNVRLPHSLDDEKLTLSLRKSFAADETPVSDSKIKIAMNGETFVSATSTRAAPGLEFDYARAVSEFKDKVATLDETPIELRVARTQPTITPENVDAAAALVPSALSLAPTELTTDSANWKFTARDLAQLLTVTIRNDGVPTLSIDYAAATEYFNGLAAAYDVAPVPTKYEFDPETKKMSSFQAGSDGRKINVEASIGALSAALEKRLADPSSPAPWNLVATTDKTKIINQTAEELGIKEILGVGISDFSGSSSARIANVKNGAGKLNGVLIAPDEEFSVNKIIGPVTRENGYVPEQIIKGNLIVSEVGGGLCQIGTTTFRAAMMSGLPITARINHALIVHYYSDARNGNPGTDATLYDPYTDLRFKNDTGHWMLMTTEINVKTKKAAFTLWGTSDGRNGSYSAPQVIKWIDPPKDEVMQVDKPDLKPGEQKCQNPFRGANTVFTYTIKNADGTITERKFNSRYRALPKICMNGPALPNAEAPAADNQITNTNANVPVNANANVPAAASAVLPPEAVLGN